MKKRTKLAGAAGAGGMVWLVLMLMLFLAGAVIGSFFAANIQITGQRYLGIYAVDSLGNSAPELRYLLLAEAVMLAVVFFSAFFRWGILAPPVVLMAKGFTLSLLVTTFVKAFGIKGFLAALAAVLLWGLVSATCLVLMGLQAMSMAARRAATGGRGRLPIDRAYYLSALICLVAMLGSSLLHSYITPVISRAVAGIG